MSAIDRKGREFPVELSVWPAGGGSDAVGYHAFVHDISERRAHENALRESEAKYRHLADLLAAAQQSAGIGSWDWDIAVDRVTWSDELCRLFGVDPTTFVATYAGYLEHVHPDDRELVEGTIGAAFASGEEFAFDHRLVRPDGAVGWLQARGKVEVGADGRPVRMSGTALDITERAALQQDLSDARDRAVESSRLKSEFLATMSHEIRTPMNGVIGLTALLLDTGLSDTQRQYANGVRGSGEALMAIINDILDFSKIEAGKLELELVDFDLAQAMHDVAALMAEPARSKGLELVVECLPGVPPMVRGDVGRVRQILLNLVSNAVKFTHTGKVVVRARAGKVAGASCAVVLEVADSGIGIAPETAERLFEPFSQADASTTRRYGGTGLGLAISRRLAEAMGGTIGVDSQLDEGSTFWLKLPFGQVSDPSARADAPPTGQALPPAHSTGSRGRLLIVEDNAVNQAVAKGMVAKLGYDCDLAGNGIEALQALERRHYDAVLMDCQMPEMDGFEATAEIRRRQIRRRGTGDGLIPVIAMTAGALIEDRGKCLSAGMDDYLPKPVRGRDLDQMLARWLGVGDE